MLKSIDQLKQEQAEELARLERAHAIAALLPVPPKYVHSDRVSYEARSLAEAADLMEKFPDKLPYVDVSENNIRYIDLPDRMPESRRSRPDAREADGAPFLYLSNYGRGFGTDATFYFYTMVDGKPWKIVVYVKPCPWHIHLVRSDGSQREDRRIIRKDYPSLDGAVCRRMNNGDGGAAYYLWYNENDFAAFVRNNVAG